jgi:hypothetical protein
MGPHHPHHHPHHGPRGWGGGFWDLGYGGDVYNIYNQPELVEDDHGDLYWLYPDGTTVFFLSAAQRASAGY